MSVDCHSQMTKACLSHSPSQTFKEQVIQTMKQFLTEVKVPSLEEDYVYLTRCLLLNTLRLHEAFHWGALNGSNYFRVASRSLARLDLFHFD